MGPEGYSAKQLAKLLDTTADRIRGYVREGFVEPARGERGEYRFSFQDVVLLRTAEALAKQVPPARVKRALRGLASRLPKGRALATVKIVFEGDELVVREGDASFQAESGQGLLDFGVEDLVTEAAPLAMKTGRQAHEAEPRRPAEEWFERGHELESVTIGEAITAYRKALEVDPEHTHALINLGRLVHEQGDSREAASLYLRALETDPEDPLALFNLGVALEDLGRLNYARKCYEHTLQIDPRHADAHFNVARLCERLGDKAAAMRHLMQYRALT